MDDRACYSQTPLSITAELALIGFSNQKKLYTVFYLKSALQLVKILSKLNTLESIVKHGSK